jgi:hypothetical protein
VIRLLEGPQLTHRKFFDRLADELFDIAKEKMEEEGTFRPARTPGHPPPKLLLPQQPPKTTAPETGLPLPQSCASHCHRPSKFVKGFRKNCYVCVVEENFVEGAARKTKSGIRKEFPKATGPFHLFIFKGMILNTMLVT